MHCPEIPFVATLHDQMVKIGTLIALYQCLRSFLIKMWEFDTPGSPCIVLLPTGMAFI